MPALESADGGITSRFRQANGELLVQRIRLISTVGVVVYFGFFYLDLALAPQRWKLMLTGRLLGVGMILGALAVSRTRFGRRWLVPISVGCYTAVALTLVAMTPTLGGFASNYYVGVMLVMFSAGLLMPWPLVGTVLFCVVIEGCYFALNVALFGLSSQALAPMLFLSGTAFFTVLATETSWRMRRGDLQLRQRLEGANNELRALDDLKSRFFANVSHELRTPLTLIIGALREAERAVGEVSRSRVRAGLRNASHLLSLVNDLLDLTKLEGTTRTLSNQPTDISALIRQVGANFQSSGESARLQLDGVASPVVMDIDAKLLTKVVYNLLSNALKFSEEDRGLVRLTLRREPQHWAIVVEDNGIGIPEDKLAIIFDRFSQVDAREIRHYEGTGIGLALVREAVQAHGGEVSVESTLGRGSTFTVRLPRSLESSDASSEQEVLSTFEVNRTSAVDSLPCETVLSEPGNETAPLLVVADDNADLRSYLHSILLPDYRLILCKEGSSAIEMHRRYAPDLVLTDLMMPGVGGEDVIAGVRAVPSAVKTPVVVLTADIKPEVRAHLLEIGATDFIAKPFDEAELLARVGVALRLRAHEKRLDELAHLDGLTSIANRREFDRRLSETWKKQAHDQPLSLLLCDIDDFKRFNDRYGHLAGDECLKAVAQALRAATHRPTDLVARYGGEEFSVLLPATDIDGAMVVADRIVARVRGLAIPHDSSTVAEVVTISVGGYTTWPASGTDDVDTLANLADTQLYKAKQLGRNRAQVKGGDPSSAVR